MSVFLSLFTNFITNPQVLAGLGIGASVLFVFFKGKSSGEDSVKQAEQEATQALNSEVQKTESVNQQVETKNNANLQNIDSITDPDELVRMLNNLSNGGKASSDSSDKS